MTREYVEKRMRGTIGDLGSITLEKIPMSDACWIFDRAVDVALALVQEQAEEDAKIADSWETTVINKNGITDGEATFMCNDVAANIADAIRAAARKPEREGGGE